MILKETKGSYISIAKGKDEEIESQVKSLLKMLISELESNPVFSFKFLTLSIMYAEGFSILRKNIHLWPLKCSRWCHFFPLCFSANFLSFFKKKKSTYSETELFLTSLAFRSSLLKNKVNFFPIKHPFLVFGKVVSVIFFSQNQWCFLHEVLIHTLTSLAEYGHDRESVLKTHHLTWRDCLLRFAFSPWNLLNGAGEL